MAFSPCADVLRALTRYSAIGVPGMAASLPGAPRPRQTRLCYDSSMKTGLVVLIVLAVVVVGLFMWGVGVNNQLVALDQNVNASWAQVQNVYQRRADLIPNLVETVKGFAAQEREVLESVTRARASASSVQLTPEALNDPKAMERFQAAQSQLTGALSRLLVDRKS